MPCWPKQPLNELFQAEDGNVAILFALTLPLLIGGVGLGVETSYWYYEDLKLQSVADSAAYAGGLEYISGSDEAKVSAVASYSATTNGFDTTIGSIEVNLPPTSGAYTSEQAVEVILQQNVPRYFTAIFSDAPLSQTARAVAYLSFASRACLLALSTSAPKAALFSGSANLTLKGCAVASNSQAADGVKVQGSASLTVDCISSSGGVDLGLGATLTECAEPRTNAPRSPDPFASIPAPTASGACLSDNAALLLPGRYCKGMTLKGGVTLSPGVYFVEGGDFQVNAQAEVLGSGVTIYLSGGATVKINGTATVILSAPTSGPYAGILFFGDRNAPGGTNTFNGTANSDLTGAIYTPAQHVDYSGNFSGTTGCVQVVASTISWSGNATINQDCTALGMQNIPVADAVRLVE